MPLMMLVLCEKRELDKIVEEYTDWQSEGVLQVKLYGTTEKTGDGFVLVAWNTFIPEYVWAKLKQDSDVLDVLTFAPSFLPAAN